MVVFFRWALHFAGILRPFRWALPIAGILRPFRWALPIAGILRPFRAWIGGLASGDGSVGRGMMGDVQAVLEC